jgi:protein-tyrosine phosphatase
MRSSIYWIDHPKGYRLGIMARPRAGDWLNDEIVLWRADGVDTVVSLLEQEEVDALELLEEERICRSNDIEFISYPIPDRGVPHPSTAKSLAALACGMFKDGKAVAIHCRAGIGRSSLMAGAVMVMSGVEPSEAFDAIRRARGLPVPDTEEQRDWLYAFTQFLSG